MEEGGITAGTMLMTSASAFLGQRFKKPALGELRQMGIYEENDKLQNQDQLIENPFKWMQETFMPALVKAGFDTKDKQVAEVEKLTSRNSAEAAVLLGINPGNVERTAQSIKQDDTLNQASAAITANDPRAAMRASEAGLANLASAFGGPFIPSITGGLSNLANALNWTASLTKPHLGPDGKPLLLDSAHDETGDWLRSFATPSSSADKEPLLGHQISGRDPQSPSTGPYAYTPMAPARAYDPLSSIHAAGALMPIPVSIVNAPGSAAAPHVESAAPTRPYDPLSSIHAPSIASPPVTISSPITAPRNGNAQVTVNINNDGIVASVTKIVDARIQGAFSGLMSMFKSGAGNSAASFDGRQSPQTPDGSTFAH
jgi:hypothetical protein